MLLRTLPRGVQKGGGGWEWELARISRPPVPVPTEPGVARVWARPGQWRLQWGPDKTQESKKKKKVTQPRKTGKKKKKRQGAAPRSPGHWPLCHMTLCPKICPTHARFAVKPARTQAVRHAYLGPGRPLAAQGLGRGGRPPPPHQCRTAPARQRRGAVGARAAVRGTTQRPAVAARPGQGVSEELLEPSQPRHRPPLPRRNGAAVGGLKAVPLTPPSPGPSRSVALARLGEPPHTPRSAQERHGQTAAAASW